jgi:hypothetical protein
LGTNVLEKRSQLPISTSRDDRRVGFPFLRGASERRLGVVSGRLAVAEGARTFTP